MNPHPLQQEWVSGSLQYARSSANPHNSKFGPTGQLAGHC